MDRQKEGQGSDNKKVLEYTVGMPINSKLVHDTHCAGIGPSIARTVSSGSTFVACVGPYLS